MEWIRSNVPDPDAPAQWVTCPFVLHGVHANSTGTAKEREVFRNSKAGKIKAAEGGANADPRTA